MDTLDLDIARVRALHGIACGFARLKWLRDATRFELAMHRHALALKYGYNPAQPRDELGQWVDANGNEVRPEKVRLAASEPPRLGPRSKLAIAVVIAKEAIKLFRDKNLLHDLFGKNEGTVAYTKINDVEIYGVNSDSSEYKDRDLVAAERMRAKLIEKYPDIMASDNIGQKPNDGVFHAEANALSRAARENGGSLAGQNLEVHVDKPMCPSCDRVLPLIGRELGDPTVTFVGPTGSIKVMRSGKWIR